MKLPTSWSSATKQQTDWSQAAHSASEWVNNDVKATATWANNDVKNPSDWNVPPTAQQTYFYEDSGRNYEDIGYEYEFIVNGNSFSNRNQTTWSAA